MRDELLLKLRKNQPFVDHSSSYHEPGAHWVFHRAPQFIVALCLESLFLFCRRYFAKPRICREGAPSSNEATTASTSKSFSSHRFLSLFFPSQHRASFQGKFGAQMRWSSLARSSRWVMEETYPHNPFRPPTQWLIQIGMFYVVAKDQGYCTSHMQTTNTHRKFTYTPQ